MHKTVLVAATVLAAGIGVIAAVPAGAASAQGASTSHIIQGWERIGEYPTSWECNEAGQRLSNRWNCVSTVADLWVLYIYRA